MPRWSDPCPPAPLMSGDDDDARTQKADTADDLRAQTGGVGIGIEVYWFKSITEAAPMHTTTWVRSPAACPIFDL